MGLPLTILAYRRILARPDPLFPDAIDAARFEQHLRVLTRWFRVIPLGDAVAQMRAGRLPARAACITFERGYAAATEVALPLLQRFRVRATFFVASGLLDGAGLWDDALADVLRNAPGARLNLGRSGFGSFDIGCIVRRRAVLATLMAALAGLADDERSARVRAMARRFTCVMLSADQLLALHRAGMEIGAHPAGHPVLTALSNAAARSDIAAGRAGLQEIIQAPVDLFAYPGGLPGRDFERRHAAMLRAQGFQAAVCGAAGTVRPHTDLFALPRLAPRGDARGFAMQIATNLLRGAP